MTYDRISADWRVPSTVSAKVSPTSCSSCRSFDDTIAVLPWAVKDQHHNLPIAINSISHSFFNLQTYMPGLVSINVSLRTWLELGDTQHSSLSFRSSVSPTQEMVNQLGLWLRATRQGMWIFQLPLTKQTKCIGWLLYSAPEYPLDSLHLQIKQDTVIEVELHFCSISDYGSSQANCTMPHTKAIHLEFDSSTLPSQLKRIERVYSAEAKTFPLGIKMWLVHAWRTGTNVDHKNTKVRQLIMLQAHFLKYTETRWTSKEGYNLVPQWCPLYDTLWAMRLLPCLAN